MGKGERRHVASSAFIQVKDSPRLTFDKDDLLTFTQSSRSLTVSTARSSSLCCRDSKSSRYLSWFSVVVSPFV